MLRLLTHANHSQLMSYLRQVKKLLSGVSTGNTLLLPAIVQSKEILLLVERTTDTSFKIVIVQTDANAGLKYHAVSPLAPPELQYRTCLVLSNIPKKQALDDVFWMALYNLAISGHEGDTDKFYDVLLPFLTGRPLESSLVDSEALADSGEPGLCADWRSPQRSQTAYVRCIFEAMHYMLRARGLDVTEAEQVELAVNAQLLHFAKNDLQHMHPDESGQRICSMALTQISNAAVTLADKVERSDKRFPSGVLDKLRGLVNGITRELKACADDSLDLPELLDLGGEERDAEAAFMQFKSMLAWDAEPNVPDPGQVASLHRYMPIDALQIPAKASTRDEAVSALRHADRLCTLLDNQSHCIKNDKFIIAALLEHTFTQAVCILYIYMCNA